MYSEFVENTGCKQNEHNYKVFQNLEAMYMNTEMTKEEIYEYGKKLVDNSKSKEEIETERKINSEIEECRAEIKWYKYEIERYTAYLNETYCTPDEIKNYKARIKNFQQKNREYRAQIKVLKEIIV